MALQMTWQPSLGLLHQKRKSGPPLGLRNLGNTCYLNSVLQCLTYTPPLANFCLKFQHSSSCDSATERDRKSECPFCVLEKRIVRSLSIDQALDAPAKINNSLKIFAEHFRFGRQQDAHEFLRYVIDACHNTCLRLKKLQQRRKGGNNVANGGGEGFSGSTVVKEIFGGALQSQVKCLSCGAESNKVDEIMDMSLDVLHSSSLKEALQKFFQPEILDGSNKYKCDNCKKLVAARKQMSILQAPNVLVIQLKRFEGIFGGKIDKAIAFEEVLVLSSFMCKDPHPEYNLFGTIVHSGLTPDSGHYYAYIKDAMGHWYCCNDSYVTLSTLQDVLSEKVYILFFSRTKQRPGAANAALATNGTKSHACNGSDTPKIPEADHPVKSLNMKQSVDRPSEKENSTTSKVDKVPLGPQIKLSSFGKSGTKKCPVTTNVKIVVNKRESNEKNGDVKSSICMEKGENNIPSLIDKNSVSMEKGENNIPSLIDKNSVSKSKPVDGENSQAFPLPNENVKIQSIGVNSLEAYQCKDNGTRNRTAMGRGPNHQELQNGIAKFPSDNSVSKRKFEDEGSCVLLAKDAQSRAELEELKEVLRKKAASVLQSCGWLDKVYNFMLSRKKLCVREAGNDASSEAGNDASSRNKIKRLLIADSKATFISQIPEPLKESLIELLRSFIEEKQFSGPRVTKHVS